MRLHDRAATVAVAGLITFISGAALAAPGTLGGTLSQMVDRWENGDPNLSTLLSAHLASRTGEPVVKLRIADGVAVSSVLPELSALGFRVTATSSIDSRFVEGFLPIGSARAISSVPGVQSVRAQLKPIANAGAVQSQ